MSMIPYTQLPAQQPEPQFGGAQPPPPAGGDQFGHIPTVQEMPLPQQQQQQTQQLSPVQKLQQDYQQQVALIQQQQQQIAEMGLPPQDHAAAIQELQDNWNELYAEHSHRMQNLQFTQQMIERGELDPELGALAMWQQAVPPEVGRQMQAEWKLRQDQRAAAGQGRQVDMGRLMPRTDRDGDPVPSQFESLIMEYIQPLVERKGRAEAAHDAVTQNPGRLQRIAPYWAAFLAPGERQPTTQDITRQYLQMRAETGYDTYSPEARRQFDTIWDRVLHDQGVESDVWNRDMPSVQALRATGPLARAATRGLHPGGGPLARDLAETVRSTRQQRQVQEEQSKQVLTEDVIDAILQEAGGDAQLATQIARQRGYTW